MQIICIVLLTSAAIFFVAACIDHFFSEIRRTALETLITEQRRRIENLEVIVVEHAKRLKNK